MQTNQEHLVTVPGPEHSKQLEQGKALSLERQLEKEQEQLMPSSVSELLSKKYFAYQEVDFQRTRLVWSAGLR